MIPAPGTLPSDGAPQGSQRARMAQALVWGARRAAADVAAVLAVWAAWDLLGARDADQLAAVLGCSRRSAFRALAAYRGAWAAASTFESGIESGEPPGTNAKSGTATVPPLAPLARGEGGSLPSGSVRLSRMGDLTPETAEDAALAPLAAVVKEGAGGERRAAPPGALAAAAHHLRARLCLSERDVRFVMAHVTERWSRYGATVTSPEPWAVRVAEAKARELGLRSRTGAEAAVALRSLTPCAGCGRHREPDSGCSNCGLGPSQGPP